MFTGGVYDGHFLRGAWPQALQANACGPRQLPITPYYDPSAQSENHTGLRLKNCRKRRGR